MTCCASRPGIHHPNRSLQSIWSVSFTTKIKSSLIHWIPDRPYITWDRHTIKGRQLVLFFFKVAPLNLRTLWHHTNYFTYFISLAYLLTDWLTYPTWVHIQCRIFFNPRVLKEAEIVPTGTQDTDFSKYCFLPGTWKWVSSIPRHILFWYTSAKLLAVGGATLPWKRLWMR